MIRLALTSAYGPVLFRRRNPLGMRSDIVIR